LSSLSARFIGASGSRIFVVSRHPASRSGAGVLLVPPFGEEMNKTRGMYSDVAAGLAHRGVATALPDLFGTGDSDGEFREASWDRWVADLRSTLAWMAEEGWPVRGVLATRLGCCLAAEAVKGWSAAMHTTVFWQPVAEGSRFLTQFLRLRVAASMMEPDRKETASGLRQRLRAGEMLEVAGYEISPKLAEQIEAVRLATALDPRLGGLHWMEIVRDAQSAMPADAERAVAEARSAGSAPQVRLTAGEPFWASTEIVRVPELTRQTIETLSAVA
jgi:exosortase A-associated hydrolase 2